MRHRVRLSGLFAVGIAVALTGCGEMQDWRSTQRADTLEAYETFLDRYPDSSYAPVAQRRATDLLEQRDWQIASQADTAEAYRRFLDTHPKGRWAREARVRLQNFMTTPGVLGPPALEPLEGPPPPAMLPPELESNDVTPTTSPPSPSSSSGEAPLPDARQPVEHRIQLGAFSSRELAEEAWRSARARHRELQGLVSQVMPSRSAAATVFRLQATVVSEARAREACRVLVGSGQPCVYVPPATR